MKKIIVIGGGAAGMMAAIMASHDKKNEVILLEKNEKLGKKLFITGKGRCNITNAGDMEDVINSVVTNKKFLYSAFNGFSNYDAMGFFSEMGLEIKVERGNRVFPESDHSSDVIRVLEKCLKKEGVKINLNCKVTEIITENNRFSKVAYIDESGKEKYISADSVVIATGGNSYQLTGSTGDGYKFAKKMGHKVEKILPALVPLNVKEEWSLSLQGLSLKNITAKIIDDGKEVYSEFGEMLFTHFGVSGPVILSASSYITEKLKNSEMRLVIDMKPALSEEQLDERILRDFDKEKNKAFKNSLDGLLPKKMIPVVIMLSGISPEKKINEITREERTGLVRILKNFTLTITGTRGFGEAIITHGGVCVKEINPKTMESKLVKNVYYAGEVIDTDALTGGFNLQIAWSTGYSAGISAGDISGVNK